MSTAPTKPSSGFDTFGYGLAIAGSVLFSTKGIFIKLAYGYGVSTEMLLSLRMVVALPVYLVILASLFRRDSGLGRALSPRVVLATMAIGILGYYVSSYLDFLGLNFVSAQYERLVLFTYPFFVVLFGAWFFGERLVWRVIPPMLVSYAGLVVLFGWNLVTAPDGIVAGTLLVLGSAITFALYQHLARRQMARGLGSAAFTCIAMSTAAVCAILQGVVVEGPAAYAALPVEVWVFGLALGIFGTVLPSLLMNAGMSRIGARATASTAAIGPVVTIGMAVAILGEPFSGVDAVGAGLVILGSVLFTRAEQRARSGS